MRRGSIIRIRHLGLASNMPSVLVSQLQPRSRQEDLEVCHSRWSEDNSAFEVVYMRDAVVAALFGIACCS